MKRIVEAIKKEIAYNKACREWDKQFPLLSCHYPYVSDEEMEVLERILKERKKRYYDNRTITSK